MPTIKGKDVRVQIGTTAVIDGAYSPIGGEVSVTWDDSSGAIDTSSKDDGEYNLTEHSGRTVGFSFNGKLRLPDAGFERFAAVRKLSPPLAPLRITRGAVIMYEGLCSFGSSPSTHENNAASTWSGTAAPAAVPTIDNLAAVG